MLLRWIHIIFMLMAWIAFGMAFSAIGTMMYWLIIQDRNPITLNYEHDKFVGREVATADAAQKYEITTARRGDTVYRFQDYCLRERVESVIQRHWSNGIVMQLPVVAGVGQVGCFRRSFPIVVPDELRPGQTYTFHWRAQVPINPLVTLTFERRALTLRVVE